MIVWNNNLLFWNRLVKNNVLEILRVLLLGFTAENLWISKNLIKTLKLRFQHRNPEGICRFYVQHFGTLRLLSSHFLQTDRLFVLLVRIRYDTG